jgi:hypothetical protein
MVVERRRRRRVDVSFAVERLRGSYPEPGTMLSMSEQGFLVRLSGRPPIVGELMRLRVSLPAGELVVHAVATRLVDESESILVACRTFALSGAEKERWEEAVAGALEQHAQAA